MSSATYDRLEDGGDQQPLGILRRVVSSLAIVVFGGVGLYLVCQGVEDVDETGYICKHEQINVLQFNPHAECFIPKFEGHRDCEGHALDLIGNLLQGRSTYDFKSYEKLDFASIEYMGSSSKLTLPAGWNKTVHDCSDKGNGDDVTFLYNSELWTPIGSPRSGCMGPADNNVGGFTRPFLVQTLESPNLGLKVIVVAAHFPHPSNWDEQHQKLKEAIQAEAVQGVEKVILIADTNFATQMMPFPDDLEPKSSKDIFADIGAENHRIQTTDGLLTCCETVWYHTGYDRVVANFGGHMTTDVGLNMSAADRWASRFMHLPMVGSLCLG